MDRPDITKAQIAALLQAIIAVAVAGGVPISQTLQAEVLGLSGIIATVLMVADATIRKHRNQTEQSAHHADAAHVLASAATDHE